MYSGINNLYVKAMENVLNSSIPDHTFLHKAVEYAVKIAYFSRGWNSSNFMPRGVQEYFFKSAHQVLKLSNKIDKIIKLCVVKLNDSAAHRSRIEDIFRTLYETTYNSSLENDTKLYMEFWGMVIKWEDREMLKNYVEDVKYADFFYRCTGVSNQVCIDFKSKFEAYQPFCNDEELERQILHCMSKNGGSVGLEAYQNFLAQNHSYPTDSVETSYAFWDGIHVKGVWF
jgi:hypothetical protein